MPSAYTTKKEKQTIVLDRLNEQGKQSFQQIMQTPSLSENRNSVKSLLDEMEQENLITRLNQDTWKRGQPLWHAITPKGKIMLFTNISEKLKKACQTLHNLVEKMSSPDKIRQYRKEGTYYPEDPTDETVFGGIEEMLKYKDKVFGDLEDAFKKLTWVLALVQGPVDVQKDLSNVSIRYINGRPVIKVSGDFKESGGSYCLPPALVEREEYLSRMRKKRLERDGNPNVPHSAILLFKDGETIFVDHKTIKESSKREKSWGWLREHYRTKREEEKKEKPEGDGLEAAVEKMRWKMGLKSRKG